VRHAASRPVRVPTEARRDAVGCTAWTPACEQTRPARRAVSVIWLLLVVRCRCRFRVPPLLLLLARPPGACLQLVIARSGRVVRSVGRPVPVPVPAKSH
jgi:hypothetical protein